MLLPLFAEGFLVEGNAKKHPVVQGQAVAQLLLWSEACRASQLEAATANRRGNKGAAWGNKRQLSFAVIHPKRKASLSAHNKHQ